MPRTYQSLVESYDAMIISDPNVGSFTPDRHKSFERSVAEAGLGLVVAGGHGRFGGM